jgi:hypothetical protein
LLLDVILELIKVDLLGLLLDSIGDDILHAVAPPPRWRDEVADCPLDGQAALAVLTGSPLGNVSMVASTSSPLLHALREEVPGENRDPGSLTKRSEASHQGPSYTSRH